MTFLPMILVVLFARVGFGEPSVAHRVHAFSDRPHAKAHKPRPAWENSNGTGLSWRFREQKRRSRQNRRLLTNGLGKPLGNRFIMAISPGKSGNPAKTGDLRPTWGNSNGNRFMMAVTLFCDGAPAKTGDRVWGNSNGKRFIMATLPEKAEFTPKPATFDPRFGKNILETVYLGDRETKRDPISETFRIGKTLRIGETTKAPPHCLSVRR